MPVLLVTYVSGGVHFTLLCSSVIIDLDVKIISFVESRSLSVDGFRCILYLVSKLIGLVGPGKRRSYAHSLFV